MQAFKARRQKLLEQLGNKDIAIVAAAPEVLRNGDAHFAYRQRSDFYYLTGFVEPNALAVFIPGHSDGEFILFCNPKDPLMETWDGKRAGVEGAVAEFGADVAYDIDELETRLPELLLGRDKIHYSVGREQWLDSKLMEWTNAARVKGRKGVNTPQAFNNIDVIVHAMRSVKSDDEIALMQKSTDIAVLAHTRAMQSVHPGMMEYQLQAELNYIFNQHGAVDAYTPSVAGGNNACILHYLNNDQALRDGDLVLIDMGAEYQFYASDITRTFPVNGKFSKEQQALYEVVLEANLAGIDTARSGALWTDLQDTAVRILTQGLIDLKIVDASLDNAINDKLYLPFYMHGVSHWMGLDVHDVGFYRTNDGESARKLEPGMAMSMEPGLYIEEGMQGVDKKWWGIGIRLEDDIVITNDKANVLSRDLVKTVEDIEALMAE